MHRVLPLVALFVALPLLAAPADVRARALVAARALLAALPPPMERRVQFGYDHPERFDLHLYPFFLDGLPLRRMEAPAQAHLRELLAATLSERGLAQVDQVRSLETDVARLELRKGGIWWAVRPFRHPDRYVATLFGEPAEEAPWGFRFEGHHVSLNATFAPGQTPSATPFFLGSQPRVVEAGVEHAGLQVLREEEEQARSLLAGLDAGQRARALLPFSPGRALFTGSAPRVEPFAPQGLARREMSPAQQTALDALIEVYLGRVAPEIAHAVRSRHDDAGRDGISFAWAGSDVPGEASYYRIHGPTVLIEFDNSLPAADHVHTIWRELDSDFGLDPLALHYATSH